MIPFKNPPITEAVFDIRVSLPDATNLDVLKSFHNEVKERYPIIRDRRKIEGGFRFDAGAKPRVISSKDEIYGYMFYSSDQSSVVQARLDGFSFNKLKPYSNWEEFSKCAFDLWGIYVKIARPCKINRLSLRYINRIELPLPLKSFDEYVLTSPGLAPTIDFGVANFFTKMVMTNPEIDAIANLTEAIEQEDTVKNVLPLIFDIDVVKNVDLEVSNMDAVVDIMNKLREFKNKLFLESFTDKTKDLFK